uniref:Uncharacterized protein n=1 Tax=Melopsittacus undulatus TaxID=13146 RepID=A0A8V5GGW1_MELUD
MRNEARRLRTFRQWPADSPVSPQDLARAGFYYLGPGDEVRCFCCSGILKDWVPGDCPVAEHRKYFPSCKFIRGEPVGNQGMPPHPQEAADAVDGQVVKSLKCFVSQALPCLEELIVVCNVIAMDFDVVSVFRAVENKHTTTGTFYLSESELIADVLKAGSTAENEPWLSTEEQLKRLQEQRLCKVCMDRDVSIVFVPCGHLVVCRACAFNLSFCPICREPIVDRVRTFMS